MKIELKMDPKTIPNLQKLSLKSIPKTGAEKTPQKRANVSKRDHLGGQFGPHLEFGSAPRVKPGFTHLISGGGQGRFLFWTDVGTSFFALLETFGSQTVAKHSSI